MFQPLSSSFFEGKVYKFFFICLMLRWLRCARFLLFFLFVGTAAATLSLLHVLSLNAAWTSAAEW